MNTELVKNLALQAGGSHYYGINTLQLEKMVELVVKECAKITFNGEPQDGNRFKIGKEILQHFGMSKI